MGDVDKVKGTFVPAVFVRELGPAAGMLLAQIVYWHTKADKGKSRFIVHRHGYRFLAHSYEQLAVETGLSVQSIKSLMRRLKTDGIIRVEQHRFDNIVPCHIRFREDCPDWVGEGLPPGWSLSDLLGMAENANPYKGETELKTHKDCSAPSAPPFTKGNEKIKKGNIPAVEPDTGGEGEVRPVQLADTFRASWEVKYPTDTLLPFGMKDFGQFANIIEKCPPGQAANVVDHAVRHWGDFISHASAAEGAFNLPQRPTVGHLLKFLGSAVNVYWEHLKYAELSAKKKELASAKKMMPCPTKPPTPEPEVDDADKPATLDEVAKMWGHAVGAALH